MEMLKWGADQSFLSPAADGLDDRALGSNQGLTARITRASLK
jgi:hypothetical protein